MVEFFDVDAAFGIGLIPPMKYAAMADELLDEMDFCGISQALVYDAAMRDDTPQVGNELLISRIRDRPRLHGTWAILPHQTGEVPPPEQFVAQMKQHNIKALRAFPQSHSYLLNGVTFGPLLEMMVAAGVPLLLDEDWEMTTNLLKEFPRLTLITILRSNHGQDRYFRPLLEKYPNFLLSTTRYECDGAIRELAQQYGAHRLVFGTGYPAVPMGGAMLSLLHCGLPEEDIEAIASGNLKRILAEVKL